MYVGVYNFDHLKNKYLYNNNCGLYFCYPRQMIYILRDSAEHESTLSP